jgi:serine/threonine protein kinase
LPTSGADLYSLGATMYEMAAGHPPFAGTREEILAARRAGPPPPLRRDDLLEALRDLIFSLLSPEPEQRPASAAEVIERLEGIRVARAEMERLLTSAETTTLEFKPALCTPRKTSTPDENGQLSKPPRYFEHEIVKTISAFLNTDGGTLIIGVMDDHTTIGIEADYPTVYKHSSDGWCLTFDNLVCSQLGTTVMSYIELQLEPWQGWTIAIVRCSKREEPTLIDDDEFFVRRTASTVKLSTREVLAWCERWG